MAIKRVRDDVAPCVAWDFNIDGFRVISPGAAFDADDPFVRAQAWAFGVESEVEQATAAPGQKRAVRRKDG